MSGATLPGRGTGSPLPTWRMIATRQLELRRRRGLMIVVALLTVGLPVLVLGLRLLFHAVDSGSYGPAGTPGVFVGLANAMAEFGFIGAAALGTAAGTNDLSEGVFRHLVVTGRSRLALYLARLPAALSLLLPLVAVAFTALCLVTGYAGTRQPTSVTVNGYSVPARLDRSQLESWLSRHPGQAARDFAIASPPRPGATAAAGVRSALERQMPAIYSTYSSDEQASSNPTAGQMTDVGLWVTLEVGIGLVVGLGLGSLTGQRTVSTVMLIVLEIIVTPILANATIPYFVNGQRLFFGVAMDQLRPSALTATGGHHGPVGVLAGKGGGLGIPPMPTWAMIAVIVGWLAVWSVLGAWKMVTRDA